MSLFTRFDRQALRAHPLRPLAAIESEPDPRGGPLWRWCQQGSGPGGHPLPWGLPRVERRFALALVEAEGEPGARRLEALARGLDGDLLLRACSGPAARWALKLRVKAQDACWWRQRQASDIWDCGYLDGRPERLARLAGFRPRRPTLMLADPGLSLAGVQAALAALHSARAGFAHPVRLLVGVPAAARADWSIALAPYAPAWLS